MTVTEKKKLALIKNVLQTIPFPRWGKTLVGQAGYCRDMEVAVPLIISLLDSILWDEKQSAEVTVADLDAWLKGRIADDWK